MVQVGLLDILRSYKSCDAESEVEVIAWIQSIGRREIADLFRTEAHRARGGLRSSDLELPEPISDQPSPRVQAALESLEVATSTLHPHSQLLLWARVVGGMTWSEVGAELGIPASAAKRRWQRLQKSLRNGCRFLA